MTMNLICIVICDRQDISRSNVPASSVVRSRTTRGQFLRAVHLRNDPILRLYFLRLYGCKVSISFICSAHPFTVLLARLPGILLDRMVVYLSDSKDTDCIPSLSSASFPSTLSKRHRWAISTASGICSTKVFLYSFLFRKLLHRR